MAKQKQLRLGDKSEVPYKLQIGRFEHVPEPLGTGYTMPMERERGAYLQANGADVIIGGYASALNRCGELNDEIKANGSWEAGWRFVPVAVGKEQQTSMDV